MFYVRRNKNNLLTLKKQKSFGEIIVSSTVIRREKAKRYAILIVEDDANFAFLEKEMIEDNFDYPVIIRHTINSVNQEDIDAAKLAIMDFNLPDATGEELIKTFRKHSDVPVLVVTGNQQLETAIKTLREGANDFLVKSPQTLIMLPNAIERALSEYKNKQLLKKEEIKQERLDAQVETLRQVLTTLAHYINNSTTTISGYAQLCQQNCQDSNNLNKLINVSIKETARITFVLQELENLVNNLEMKTTSYLDIPDAMFAVEERIQEKMKKLSKK